MVVVREQTWTKTWPNRRIKCSHFYWPYPPGPKFEGFTLSIFQIPDAEAIILF